MSATIVPASEAKTKFFELLKRARGGECFLITLDGQEAARLSPLKESPGENELIALFARIGEVRKRTVLNPKGKAKISIRELIEEGRR
jgi:prevent-host-death family protein